MLSWARENIEIERIQASDFDQERGLSDEFVVPRYKLKFKVKKIVKQVLTPYSNRMSLMQNT